MFESITVIGAGRVGSAVAARLRDRGIAVRDEGRGIPADKLETMVADDLWPLPTYREMLFIK